MPKLKRHTFVKNNKFTNWEQFLKELEQFEGKKVIYTIDSTRPRSIQQNRYYRGVVLPYVKKFLEEKLDGKFNSEDIHHELKQNFLGERVVMFGDRVVRRPLSTTELTTQQFVEFTDRIKMRFAEDGLIIPDPNQTDFLEDENE